MTRSTGQRPAVCGVLACVPFLVVACTPATSSSLTVADEEEATVCSPQQAETGRAVIALSEVDTVGGDVAIKNIALISPDNLTLLGFDMVDADDPAARVVTDDYDTYAPPPAPTRDLKAESRYVVKVGLQTDPGGGTAEALAITYVDLTGTEHVVETRIAMRLAAAGVACEAE
ncbi:hypothetical protein ACTVCO_07075 [Sanguibacter sp. A247]|uniref:hypothetical protein n=1 Tax=unclassified Sanguibacter TaxID=2645534 RepID=UPI003FD722CD